MMYRNWALACIVSSSLYGLSKPVDLDEVLSNQTEESYISFEERGMFYHYRGEKIPVSKLEYLEAGYQMQIKPDLAEMLGIWICYSCHYWNTKFENLCARCGQPRKRLKDEVPPEEVEDLRRKL